MALAVMSSKPSLRGRKTLVTKLININNNDSVGHSCNVFPQFLLLNMLRALFEMLRIQRFFLFVCLFSVYQSNLQISSLWQGMNFSQRNLLRDFVNFNISKFKRT